MAAINGIDLGQLQEEKARLDSGVTPMPLPDSESTGTVLMPVMGPVRYINVSGVKGGTFADAQTFIGYLESWITAGGKVSEPNVTFVGELNPGPYSVRVISGGWSATSDEPYMVYYNLEMVEGTFT